MKCVCGYEQEDDFYNYSRKEQIRPKTFEITLYKDLFICPKCGTIKYEDRTKG